MRMGRHACGGACGMRVSSGQPGNSREYIVALSNPDRVRCSRSGRSSWLRCLRQRARAGDAHASGHLAQREQREQRELHLKIDLAAARARCRPDASAVVPWAELAISDG